MHTDFSLEQWPTAVVKGAPQCGFFYAGVTAANDMEAGQATLASHLGFIPEWAPWLPSGCAAATGGNMSLFTDAHYLFPHLKAPLFVRENQFDTAKLGNYGWDGSDAAYLKLWGQWTRAQLATIKRSPKDGYFSAACLEHGGNFGLCHARSLARTHIGFASSPVVKGVSMRHAMHDWYFQTADAARTQCTMDDCPVTGGTGLPCTTPGGGRCPHWKPRPDPVPGNGTLSAQCMKEL